MLVYKGTLVRKSVSVNSHEISHSYSRHPVSITVNPKHCVASRSILLSSLWNSAAENIPAISYLYFWSLVNTGHRGILFQCSSDTSAELHYLLGMILFTIHWRSNHYIILSGEPLLSHLSSQPSNKLPLIQPKLQKEKFTMLHTLPMGKSLQKNTISLPLTWASFFCLFVLGGLEKRKKG